MTLIKSFVDALDDAREGKIMVSSCGTRRATFYKTLLIDLNKPKLHPFIIEMTDLYQDWMIRDKEDKDVIPDAPKL